MNSRFVQLFLALRRVQRFLDAHSHVVGPVNVSGARLALDESVARAAEYSVRRHAAHERRKTETLRRRLLAATLRLDHLRPIARIAASFAADKPELSTLTSLDAPGRPSDLIGRVKSLHAATRDHMTAFVGYGLPSSFLTDADACAQALKDSMAIDRREQAELARAARGIEEESARGRRALDVIDALVAKRIAHDPALLAAWRAASRRSEPARDPERDAEQEAA